MTAPEVAVDGEHILVGGLRLTLAEATDLSASLARAVKREHERRQMLEADTAVGLEMARLGRRRVEVDGATMWADDDGRLWCRPAFGRYATREGWLPGTRLVLYGGRVAHVANGRTYCTCGAWLNNDARPAPADTPPCRAHRP